MGETIVKSQPQSLKVSIKDFRALFCFTKRKVTRLSRIIKNLINNLASNAEQKLNKTGNYNIMKYLRENLHVQEKSTDQIKLASGLFEMEKLGQYRMYDGFLFIHRYKVHL